VRQGRVAPERLLDVIAQLQQALQVAQQQLQAAQKRIEELEKMNEDFRRLVQVNDEFAVGEKLFYSDQLDKINVQISETRDYRGRTCLANRRNECRA
jgi:hypothetical protein